MVKEEEEAPPIRITNPRSTTISKGNREELQGAGQT